MKDSWVLKKPVPEQSLKRYRNVTKLRSFLCTLLLMTSVYMKYVIRASTARELPD